MNASTAVALAAVALVLVGAVIFYQQQQAANAAAAYSRTLGGSIAQTIGGVGNIVGAAIGAAGSSGS